MRRYHKMIAPLGREHEKHAARFAANVTRKLPFGKSPAAKRAAAAMKK